MLVPNEHAAKRIDLRAQIEDAQRGYSRQLGVIDAGLGCRAKGFPEILSTEGTAEGTPRFVGGANPARSSYSAAPLQCVDIAL